MTKKTNTLKSFMYLLTFIIGISMNSCSDEDVFNEPEGTITLNMQNENNGKTLLGSTDVYINESNNFYSNFHQISEVGKVSNLGDKTTPKVSNLAREVAVIPGNAYQIFRSSSLINFPSGKQAVIKGSGYHQVYVSSYIKEEDTQLTGAVVKYALLFPDGSSLPDADFYLGKFSKKGDEVSLKVKKGIECVLGDREDASSTFDLTVSEGVLSVKLKKDPDNISGPYGDYSIYIRLNEVCVRVIMSVV